jgi:hypothetical protein
MRSLTPFVLALSCLMTLPAERLVGAAAEASRAEAVMVESFINDIEKAPIPYQAVRRLEASSSKLNESAWMEAFTEYSREGGFSYRVLSQGGSERILNRALKGVLDSEKENIAEWRKGALTRENYDMIFETRTPDGLIKVQLNPRRRDSRLLDGAAWLTSQSGALVKLEGRLSKSPSFWVRWVSVTRKYAPIHGTMMPTAVDSTADVKIAGMSTFSMVYRYTTVDGQRDGTSRQILSSR